MLIISEAQKEFASSINIKKKYINQKKTYHRLEKKGLKFKLERVEIVQSDSFPLLLQQGSISEKIKRCQSLKIKVTIPLLL